MTSRAHAEQPDGDLRLQAAFPGNPGSRNPSPTPVSKYRVLPSYRTRLAGPRPACATNAADSYQVNNILVRRPSRPPVRPGLRFSERTRSIRGQLRGEPDRPRQDATRLNQGHCGSPEDNPVLILPASDAALPSPEGSAPRGNPILLPSDVSRQGHRRSCIEEGDWVACPVDLQGERLLGMAWTELQRPCTDPTLPPGYATAEG